MARSIATVGHGTLSRNDFTDLLRSVDLDVIVDIRRFPGSRRHPHFKKEEMERWLVENGIGYRWLESLGGRRRSSGESKNNAWRNESFRAYADYMATDEFAAGIDDLLALGKEGAVAIMCSESVWWRCHRRLVADHLVGVSEIPVRHVFGNGRTTEHELMSEAKLVGDHLVYKVRETSGLGDHTNG